MLRFKRMYCTYEAWFALFSCVSCFWRESQTFPSFSLRNCSASFRGFVNTYCTHTLRPTVLLWFGWIWESEPCVFVGMFLLALGPDEVIYDDVPRENSGSTTGVFIWSFSLSEVIVWCICSCLLTFLVTAGKQSCCDCTPHCTFCICFILHMVFNNYSY